MFLVAVETMTYQGDSIMARQRDRLGKSFSFILLISVLCATGMQFLLATPATAACYYEGKKYETGAIRGPYVCMPDGSWQQR